MNYQRHYCALIERAKHRVLSCYLERHHVVPRCIGGDDHPDNIVSLTPEEHFVAHLLLVKIHPGNRKIALAAMVMRVNSSKNKRSSLSNKEYGWVRKRYATAMRGHPVSDETRAKIRAPLTGRKQSEEAKAKAADFHRGRKRSPETVERLRAAQLGKRHSQESIEKMRLSNRRTLTEEQKAAKRAYRHADEARTRIAAANKGRKHSAAAIDKMRGRVYSPETKEKMRIAALRREALRRQRREAEADAN